MGRQSHYEDKKHSLLACVDKMSRSLGRAPSVRELADGIDVGVATVHSYLGKMAAEGLVQWQPKSHRSLRVTSEGHDLLLK